MLKKLINKIKNHFPSQKQFTSAFENDLYLVEFKDNTSKIVNGRDFLKLDARKIKKFKLM